MMNNLTKTELLQLHHRYKPSPELYVKEVLGIEQTWDLQNKLLAACPVAIKEHKAIYVGSGHSLGKDFISAGIGLWFLHNYIPSIVLETASTDRQVKKIMWGETLNHWRRRKIDLGGVPFANPYLEIDKADWYLIGFTTKETGASAESGGGKFQGFHSPNICIIVTEAQAVEDIIYDQIDGLTTPENVLVIFIGNPTRAKGRFAKGLKNKVDNIVFNFSCLENPNYLQRRTVIPGLASYEWVEDKRKKWGEDDPRWQGRVLGQIPDVAINKVISDADITQMLARFGVLSPYGCNAGVVVDPAGEGDDDNVFMSGRNGEPLETDTKTSIAPSVSAIKAVEMCKAINGNFIVVDCDGIGIGVWQELNKLSLSYLDGIMILKFHGSAPSEVKEVDRLVYQNMRAEAAFVSQKRVREGKAALNKNETELIEDLTEEEYFTNRRGLIQIEEKRDIKERLGRSPGRGDAYKMLQWAFEQNIPIRQKSTDIIQDRQGRGELMVVNQGQVDRPWHPQ